MFAQDYDEIGFKEYWNHPSQLVASVGLLDIPSQQRQVVGTYDILRDRNLAIFGGPGMGKSNLLQTLTMDLARKNTPEALQCLSL
ncbi:MAG: FtsK/SpoIIIE domain-containing protein [Streptococcus sp.]